MTRLIPVIMLASASIGATEGASQFLEKQSIGLPAMCGIVTTSVVLSLWLMNKFSEQSQEAAMIKDHLAMVEARVDAQLKEIKKSIDRLPCLARKPCDPGDDTTQ